MDWSLADYYRHPVDGDPGEVAALALHLAEVANDIHTQVQRLQAFQSAEFWDSSAGSQERFQEEIEDLPEDLDLVATRYENVAAALDTYHPVMAQTQQDAEYWIQQAEAAQAEVELAEQGIEEMEAFEAQAESAAQFTNENREPGSPDVQPEQWPYQDHRAALAQAQADLETAIQNCHAAVEAYGEAHRTCAEAIREAGDDDLKNDTSLLASLGRAWNTAMDLLEVTMQVLEVVIAAVAVVGMFLSIIPGLDIVFAGVMLQLSVIKLAGTLALALDGRRDWIDVTSAYIDQAAASLSFGAAILNYIPEPVSQGTSIGLAWGSAGATAAGSFFNPDSAPGAPRIDPARDAVGSVGATMDGIVGTIPFSPNTMYGSGAVGAYDLINYGNRQDGGWDTLFEPRSQMRPQVDLSHIAFEGLDVAVSPADITVPEIDLDMPELGLGDQGGSGSDVSPRPQPRGTGDLSQVPDIPVEIEVDVPAGAGA